MTRGIYWKYIVLKAPKNVNPYSIIGVRAELSDGSTIPLEEVDAFTFTLKPTVDRHARVALAAYAESCDNEQLAEEIRQILGDCRS